MILMEPPRVASKPKLLLLDEPTVGLDIPSRRALVDEVHSLTKNAGLTVLWATHLTDEVQLGDRLIVLDHGRVIAEGPVEQILAHTGTSTVDEAFQALTAGETVDA